MRTPDGAFVAGADKAFVCEPASLQFGFVPGDDERGRRLVVDVPTVGDVHTDEEP